MMTRPFGFNSVLMTALIAILSETRMRKLSMMVLTIVFLTTSTRDLLAQTVPYKTKGTNSDFSPITGDYGGYGTGTHMGKHRFMENIVVTPIAPGLFSFHSTRPQETIAADGSKFFATISGQVQLVPINPPIFSATWTG